jgi:hypothetical protein
MREEFSDSLMIERHWFYSIARYSIPSEHIKDITLSRELLDSLVQRNVDLFTFVQRSFLSHQRKRRYEFFSDSEPIGLLKIPSFDEWWRSIDYNARRCIRKSTKLGVRVKPADIDEEFIAGAQRIYNETPIRQGRRYSGYGLSIDDLNEKFTSMENSEVLGAYFRDELIGLLWVSYGYEVAAYRSFLSFIKQRDKYPNNALLAESVRRCCQKGYHFLTYGNMGYLPGLDFFKANHGFRQFFIPRYYVPLSTRGELAIKLKVYKRIEESLPPKLERALLPLYNRVSRNLIIPALH